MKALDGIFCPNIVPFHHDGSINEGELRRIISWLIDRGIHGLYPNGSTGEFARLSFEERLRVVEIVADENRGRVPILAGAAENSIELVLKAAHHYASLGIDAISVTGPYFYKVSPTGVEAYLRNIARQSPINIILYNIPQFSNEIPVSAIKRLAQDCPRIIGCKDSSRDMPRFLHTLNEVKSVRPEFTCLIGCEEILFPCLLMGANGGTLASSGVVPEAYAKLYRAFLNNDQDTCRKIQFKLLELIQCMLEAGNFPEGFRLGASLRGFQPGPPRQPPGDEDQSLAEEMRSRMACLLTECGYHEAASSCHALSQTTDSVPTPSRIDVESIVREVMRSL